MNRAKTTILCIVFATSCSVESEITTRSLGELCSESGECSSGLGCYDGFCTVPCQAISQAAPDCYFSEGACILTITAEGTVGLCHPKCQNDVCSVVGEPVVYRNVCICL